MARTRRIKTDGDAHYHLMSRTNDRRFLFEKGASGGGCWLFDARLAARNDGGIVGEVA